MALVLLLEEDDWEETVPWEQTSDNTGPVGCRVCQRSVRLKGDLFFREGNSLYDSLGGGVVPKGKCMVQG